MGVLCENVYDSFLVKSNDVGFTIYDKGRFIRKWAMINSVLKVMNWILLLENNIKEKKRVLY